jgi:hypothetical protein
MKLAAGVLDLSCTVTKLRRAICLVIRILRLLLLVLSLARPSRER